jgi:hypothetical protein
MVAGLAPDLAVIAEIMLNVALGVGKLKLCAVGLGITAERNFRR